MSNALVATRSLIAHHSRQQTSHRPLLTRLWHGSIAGYGCVCLPRSLGSRSGLAVFCVSGAPHTHTHTRTHPTTCTSCHRRFCSALRFLHTRAQRWLHSVTVSHRSLTPVTWVRLPVRPCLFAFFCLCCLPLPHGHSVRRDTVVKALAVVQWASLLLFPEVGSCANTQRLLWGRGWGAGCSQS